MSASVESKLQGGLLLALGINESKRVFSSRDDQSLRATVNEIAAKADEHGSADCRGQWATLQRVLTDGSLDAGELPLSQCILGGRPLHQGPEMTIAFVRPDMVPHISAALQQLTFDDLQDRLSRAQAATDDALVPEAGVDQITKILQDLRDLYQVAAVDRQAVLFCVRHAT